MSDDTFDRLYQQRRDKARAKSLERKIRNLLKNYADVVHIVDDCDYSSHAYFEFEIYKEM